MKQILKSLIELEISRFSIAGGKHSRKGDMGIYAIYMHTQLVKL